MGSFLYFVWQVLREGAPGACGEKMYAAEMFVMYGEYGVREHQEKGRKIIQVAELF
jgi:hypothetical protein